MLVEAGIHAILNFAPVLLRVPSHVFVRNVSFLQELAVSLSSLQRKTPQSPRHPRTDTRIRFTVLLLPKP